MTLSSIRDYCTVAALALALAGCMSAPRQEGPVKLTIAAAADLQFALDEAHRDYDMHNPGVALDIVYGSSGNFYQQIRNGAPFDLFLSADVDYPNDLVAAGVAARDSVFTYAMGRVVMWVPANSPVDPATQQFGALEDARVRHIAIADPAHAPYGRAAEAALKNAHVYGRVAPKLVLGENIAQTFQFVQSGAADAGIVALSLALAPNVKAQGRYWEIPTNLYPHLWQAGCILKRTPQPKAAAEFREFLTSGGGRAILERYGFSAPKG